jgi:hypothetical protein
VEIKNYEEGDVDVLEQLKVTAKICLFYDGVKEQTRKIKFDQREMSFKPLYTGIRFGGSNFSHLDVTGFSF